MDKPENTAGNRPNLWDAVLACACIGLLWVTVGIVLDGLRPLVDERTLTYLSGFLTQGTLAIVLLLELLLRRIKLPSLGFRAVPVKPALVSVLKAYLLVWTANVTYAIVLQLSGLNPPNSNVYTFLMAQRDIVYIVLNLVLAALLAPVFEETLFRGIIYKALRTKTGKWPAAILSAALFSGLHMDIWGFGPRFILGLLLAHLYEKYQSLYPSMGLHALNNGLIFVLALALKLPLS